MNCSAEELKAKGLYENRPASELIFLTSSEHLSIHTKGVPKSDEQRRKMSEAHKGRRHPHAWSPEAKARSEARREAKRIEILRLFNVIAQYDADGKLVAEHKTVRTAAKALGVSKSGVQKFLAFPTARRSRRKLTGVKLVLEKRYKRMKILRSQMREGDMPA